eukprot:359258-Chlamydomonas_euryale.AAC.8
MPQSTAKPCTHLRCQPGPNVAADELEHRRHQCPQHFPLGCQPQEHFLQVAAVLAAGEQVAKEQAPEEDRARVKF